MTQAILEESKDSSFHYMQRGHAEYSESSDNDCEIIAYSQSAQSQHKILIENVDRSQNFDYSEASSAIQ